MLQHKLPAVHGSSVSGMQLPSDVYSAIEPLVSCYSVSAAAAHKQQLTCAHLCLPLLLRLFMQLPISMA